MSKLVVAGVPGLDGEYELVLPPYKQREWHQIKLRTGLRPMEIEDAWRAGDPDVMTALAWVAITRAGQNGTFVWDVLGEHDVFDVLTFDFGDEPEEEDAVPPEPALPSGLSGSELDDVVSPTTSGDGTSGPSASRALTLAPTGTSD